MTIEQAIKKADDLLESMRLLAFETGAEIPIIEEVYELLIFQAKRENDPEKAATYCRAYRQVKHLIDPITLHPEIPFAD